MGYEKVPDKQNLWGKTFRTKGTANGKAVGNKLGVIEEWMAGRLEQKAGV